MVQDYLLAHWDQLPGGRPRPSRLSFLGQGTGASKACFFAFADDDPLPRYIVKMPRSLFHNERLKQELSIIEELRTTLSQDLRRTLPGPMHVVRLSGNWVIVEPVLPGQPMDSLIRPGEPSDPARTTALMGLAHDWLIRIQRGARFREGVLDTGLIYTHFLEPLEAALAHSNLTIAEARYIDDLMRAALELEGQEMPLYLYHGDFRPGNVLIDTDQVAVLDWQFSRPLAPPLQDWFSFVFRFHSRTLDLPDIDGALEAYRSAFRQLFFVRNWLSELVKDYTWAYCHSLGVDMAFLPLLFGMFVVNNINKFHAFLTERAERGYLYLLKGSPTSDRSYREQLRRQVYVWLLGDLAADSDALVLGAMATPSGTNVPSSNGRHPSSNFQVSAAYGHISPP